MIGPVLPVLCDLQPLLLHSTPHSPCTCTCFEVRREGCIPNAEIPPSSALDNPHQVLNGRDKQIIEILIIIEAIPID